LTPKDPEKKRGNNSVIQPPFPGMIDGLYIQRSD
jgi:hypothetical protein